MVTSQKIKMWARIGQIAFWLFLFFLARYEMQLPMHEEIVSSGTATETILAIFTFIFVVLFSEAIVRVIGYFAELLDM